MKGSKIDKMVEKEALGKNKKMLRKHRDNGESEADAKEEKRD